MSNYIPNKISVLKGDQIVATKSNEVGKEIYQEEDVALYLKNQLTMNNYVDCFSFHDELFCVFCSEGERYVLNPSETKFDFEAEKLIISIQNIWRAKYGGDSPEEGQGYLTIASSYFAIGGVKNLIEKSYDKDNINKIEGYCSKMAISLDTTEDEIMNFLRLTEIFLQNNKSQAQETSELKSKYNIIWNNTYYESILNIIDFNKIINNYNINFFNSKVLTKSTLDLTFKRLDSQTNEEIEQVYNFPIEFRFKNKLIQICNGDINSNSLSFNINKDNLHLMFMLWCPDLSYFNYTINNIQGSLVNPEVVDFGFSYKLFKFTFNLDNYDGGESFYYILNCFYNQGEVQDNQVFTINLSVTKL